MSDPTPFIVQKAAHLIYDLNTMRSPLGSQAMDMVARFLNEYTTELLASAELAASRDDEQVYREMVAKVRSL